MDRRRRKKKMVPGEQAQDAGMSYESELKEMFSSLDSSKLTVFAEKYVFLTPSNLLNMNYLCKLDDNHPDVDKDKFHLERKRLQHFVSAAATVSEMEICKNGHLQLLQFIVRYRIKPKLLKSS